MKKTLIFSFFALLLSVFLFGCKKVNPTVSIELQANKNSISYSLTFTDIEESSDRKYKIELSKDSTKVVEKVNSVLTKTGEFANLDFNTEYTFIVYISANKYSEEYTTKLGEKKISTELQTFEGVTFESKEFIYDGQAKSIEVSGQPEGTKVEYTNNACTEVGTHEVTAKLSKAGYNDLVLTAKITIVKGQYDFALENKTKTYDGKPLEVTADTNLELTYEYYSGETKLTTAPTNAGTYTVKAIYAGDANHEGFTKTATLVINKANSTIISQDVTKTYDGEAAIVSAIVSNGGTAVITYNTEDGQAPVNAGTYTATVSYAGNNNYAVATNVTVNIVINKAASTLELEDKEVTYNGEAQTIEADTELSVTYEYYNGESKLSAAPINAGTYTVKAIYVGDANHDPLTKEATLTIKKANTTITVDSTEITKAYDGEAVEVSATVSNGDEATITYSSTTAPVNAGTYTATISYAGNDNYNAAEDVTVTIVILKADTTISVNKTEITKVYDEQPVVVTATVSNNDQPTIIYKDNSGNTLSSAPVNAGTYTAVISYAGNNNYNAAQTITVTIIINKPGYTDVTITVSDVEVTYGVNYEIEYDVTGNAAVSKEDLEIKYYDLERNEIQKPVNAGTYKVEVSYPGSDTLFINETSKVATIVITKAQISLSIEDKEVVYNGQEQTITAVTDEELTYEYYQGETELSSAPVNVGKYTVKAIYAGDDNHESKIVEAELTIIKADTTISVENTKIVSDYNGQPVEVIATVSNGATPIITYNTNDGLAPVEVGSYTVTISYAGNDNYNSAKDVIVTIIINKVLLNTTLECVGQQIKGKTFDLATITIKKTYNDGTVEYVNDLTLVDENEESIEASSINTNVDTLTLKVLYNEEIYEIEITPIEQHELMIYAAYGAGGNSGATYKYDFIILYNNSNKEIDLNGYNLWDVAKNKKATLEGTIKAYGFYVIKCASNNTENGVDLPFEHDQECTLDFSGSKYIVALTPTKTGVDLNDIENSNYIDFLGANTEYYEGSAAAPNPTSVSMIKRVDFVDSDDNSIDFEKVLFTETDFDFLKDGYVAYYNTKNHIEGQNINFGKIEKEITFTVLSESAGKTITWSATENDEETTLVSINGNTVTATPLEHEIHTVKLVGTIEGTNFVIEKVLNLSNLEQLTNPIVSLDDNLKLSWSPVVNATSYELFIDGVSVKVYTETYDVYFYYLTNLKQNATIKVVANGPEGYLASEVTYEFDFDTIIANRIANTLNEAQAEFKEIYTLTGDNTITVLANGAKYESVTLSYESDDENVVIVQNDITLVKPVEQLTVTITVIASVEGVELENNTVEIQITLVPVTTNHLLTKVTNVDQLKDGTQIILTYNDLITIGEFASKGFVKHDLEVSGEMYIEKENDQYPFTVITLEKSGDNWLLKVSDSNYISYVSSTEIKLSGETEINSQWSLSVSNDVINIQSCKETTRYIRYSEQYSKFAAYLINNQKNINAYIIENIYDHKNNATLNEVVLENEYRINDTLTINLPETGTQYNNVALSYEVENGTINNNQLLVEVPEVQVTVTLTVTATIYNGEEAIQEERVISFVVKNKDYRLDISTDVIVGTISEQAYTGEAITPEVTVEYNGDTLVKSTHYTVAYSNNINAGTATITITFIGEEYTGTKVVNFTIIPNTDVIDISQDVIVEAIADQTHTGSQIKPTGLVVKYNEEQLKENTDYTLTYGENVNVGEGIITITFQGKYTGSKTVSFNIIETPLDITYTFSNSIPEGLTVSKKLAYYGDGGAKLDSTGYVLTSEKFNEKNNVEVTIRIGKLNTKTSSTGSGDSKSFIVEALNDSGEVIYTTYILANQVKTGDNVVTLSVEGISSVKVTFNDYPVNANGKQQNVNLTALIIKSN